MTETTNRVKEFDFNGICYEGGVPFIIYYFKNSDQEIEIKIIKKMFRNMDSKLSIMIDEDGNLLCDSRFISVKVIK